MVTLRCSPHRNQKRWHENFRKITGNIHDEVQFLNICSLSNESYAPPQMTHGNFPESFRTAFSQKHSGRFLSMPVTEFTGKVD